MEFFFFSCWLRHFEPVVEEITPRPSNLKLCFSVLSVWPFISSSPDAAWSSNSPIFSAAVFSSTTLLFSHFVSNSFVSLFTSVPCSSVIFSTTVFRSLLDLSADKVPLIFASFSFANSLSGREKSTTTARDPPFFVCSWAGLGKTKLLIHELPSGKLLCGELLLFSCTVVDFKLLFLLIGVSFSVLDFFFLMRFVFLGCVTLLSWEKWARSLKFGIDCIRGDLLGNCSSKSHNQGWFPEGKSLLSSRVNELVVDLCWCFPPFSIKVTLSLAFSKLHACLVLSSCALWWSDEFLILTFSLLWANTFFALCCPSRPLEWHCFCDNSWLQLSLPVEGTCTTPCPEPQRRLSIALRSTPCWLWKQSFPSVEATSLSVGVTILLSTATKLLSLLTEHCNTFSLSSDICCGILEANNSDFLLNALLLPLCSTILHSFSDRGWPLLSLSRASLNVTVLVTPFFWADEHREFLTSVEIVSLDKRRLELSRVIELLVFASLTVNSWKVCRLCLYFSALWNCKQE